MEMDKRGQHLERIPSPVPSANHPGSSHSSAIGEQSNSAMSLDLQSRSTGFDKAAKFQRIRKQIAASPKAHKPIRGVTKKQHRSKNEIGRLVMRAISGLKNTGGSTTRDIKKYLAEKCAVDVKSRSADIMQSLKARVQAGQLLKSEGKYKAAAKKRRSAKKSGGKKKSGGSKKRGKKSGGGKRRKGKKSADAGC